MPDYQPRLKLADIIAAPNVATHLPEDYLKLLGKRAVQGYKLDRQSRSQWEQQNEKAIKLALQVVEEKSFPWVNCSNVKFPLLTIAALQFLARISVLTKGRNLVKFESVGRDPEAKKAAQGQRLAEHISMQLLEEDANWVTADEQCKFAASLVGSAFKKTFYDSVQGINISEYVPAMNFVVDYFCKDIAKARRATHLLEMDENAIQERVRRGVFLKLRENTEAPGSNPANLLKVAADQAQGLVQPTEGEEVPGHTYQILEQHCWLDLDGDDYQEPYIMFIREDTEQVLRIVARFFDNGDVHRVNDSAVRKFEAELRKLKSPPAEGEPPRDLKLQSSVERRIKQLQDASDNHIVRIDAANHFTRYIFLPSPDGGLYGLGLGSMVGPMNEAVNSLTNQLVDAGTMSNTAGGFMGRGVKLKGGNTSFNPFEWKVVESSGDDLRKSLFPLPVREPSNVLFQLLGMFVTYSEKISGATDIMTGVSPGQNTPAETSRNTVEQGMMLFSGIYNRMYRSFREELQKFYSLNRLFLKDSPRFEDLTVGDSAILADTDYDVSGGVFRLFPAASPEAVSITQQREKAGMVLQLAGSTPGFDRYKVTRRYLEAWSVDGIDEIYPDPQGPRAIAPPPNLDLLELQQKQQQHETDTKLAIVELQQAAELNSAKIQELQAKAAKHLAEANGVDTGHQIAAIEAEIGARKAHHDSMLKALELLQRQAESNSKAKEGAGQKPAAPAAA